MKRFFVSVLTVIGVLLLLGAALTGFIFFHKYVPTNEPADQNEWFGVVGDRVAIILDNQQVEDSKGRYMNGEIYLPS